MVMAAKIAAITESITLSMSVTRQGRIHGAEIPHHRGSRDTDGLGVFTNRSNQFFMTECIAFHEAAIQIKQLRESDWHLNLLNGREVERLNYQNDRDGHTN